MILGNTSIFSASKDIDKDFFKMVGIAEFDKDISSKYMGRSKYIVRVKDYVDELKMNYIHAEYRHNDIINLISEAGR